MLKPAQLDPYAPERPIGELVHELIEEGKGYVQAEIGLVKTIAAAKGKAITLPLALFGAAFLCAFAGLTALAVGIVIALAKFIGPLGAGVAGMVLLLAIGGLLGFYGVSRLKSDL